jgi:PelA/Pel-15E family pectate lyase
MKISKTSLLLFFVFINCNSILFGQNVTSVSNEKVLATMKKAAEYMVNKVSLKGGYLWTYSEDLSGRDGEAPGRESQIMVYGGTSLMGELFLDIYDKTKDPDYIEFARKAADALIYGQHPMGGWHYLIDFEKDGIEDWYKNIASKFPAGMEEYRHYYGNCTFDDNTTQGATTFLLRFYMTTLDPAYLDPLKRALDFILIAQYPNGGWPQRFPLRSEYSCNGLPDYTSMYTLNDNAMTSTITLLLKAYQQLGDERYLEAARRGGDFFIISQGPEGHAGWAEQYDMNIQPCWARTHEPPGFMTRQTINTIGTLEELYLFTGDKRYLGPLPAAFDWLDASALRVLDNGEAEFARMYEPVSNMPIACELSDIKDENGYTQYIFKPVDKKTYLNIREHTSRFAHEVLMQFEGRSFKYNLIKAKSEYENIKSADKEKRKELYRDFYNSDRQRFFDEDELSINELLKSVNENGIWIEDVKLWDVQPGQMIEKKKTVKGFSVFSFYRNIEILLTKI